MNEFTKRQLAEQAAELNQRLIELQGETEWIDAQLIQAKINLKAGQEVSLEWMHRARHALNKKRTEAREIKAKLKQINGTLRGPSTTPELELARKQVADRRKMLHEETLRAVNIKREQETERLRLAAAKQANSDAMKFMQTAQRLLDVETYNAILTAAGLESTAASEAH
jgi:hypothetical protein